MRIEYYVYILNTHIVISYSGAHISGLKSYTLYCAFCAHYYGYHRLTFKLYALAINLMAGQHAKK